MERTILHCDCNSFFASVEQVLCPSCGEGPMAVCGDPESRHGIILAKNEQAKRFGVRTAETIWQALRKCPQLRLVRPHHDEYARFSKRVNEIYERYTDLVEPFGIDESWLDVTGSAGLFGDGKQIADRIRAEVRAQTGLTVSAGVSFNKTFAKLGSDYQKPDATTCITRENFRQLLFGLPVTDMLYVGNSVGRELAGMYIETIGQLAGANRGRLIARLGKLGGQLCDYANGLDDSPVRSAFEPREMKSMGNGMTFSRDLVGERDMRVGIEALCDELASRMRRHGVCCRTVQLQIRDTHLRTISRQRALNNPTALSRELSAAAMQLLQDCWRLDLPIRMLTVTGLGLLPAGQSAEQLSLFEPDADLRGRLQRLETAVDAVREKFGPRAVSTGAILGSDIGVTETQDER